MLYNNFPANIIVTHDSPENVLQRLEALESVKCTHDHRLYTADAKLGIEAVRDLQHFSLLPPIKARLKTVVVGDAHTLTLPAQHALLKTLEEPPAYMRIYLVTPLVNLLLETIQSRCQIQFEKSTSESLNPIPNIEGVSQIQSNTPLYQRLKTAAPYTSSIPQAVVFLKALHSHTRTGLIKNPQDQRHQHNAQLILNSLRNLNGNGHPALNVNHVLLHWQ